MKKFFALLSTVMVSLTLLCITAFAETEDVELSVARAVATNAKWGQSITYSKSDFDASRLTSDSQVLVEYEVEGEMPANGWHAVELIFQRYQVEPVIWAQIYPTEFDETSAVYNYADISAVYTDKGGAADFSDVDNVCIGDSGVVIKVTKVTVTNCSEVQVTTTTAAETEAATETTTVAETTTAAPAETTTAAATAAENAESDSDSSIITIVIIIAVAVVVIAAVIVVIVVVKNNRRRFY